jgi:Glycosyl hydrolases family 18/Fibronectin type III domain
VKLAAVTVVLVSVLALAGEVRAAQARPQATSCATRPLAVRFVRSPGRPSGVLSWRTPRKLPQRPAGYRVYRDGKVVGQTKLRVHRIRVAFTPGRPATFAVRVALRTGAVLACTGRLRTLIRWLPPAAPVDLVVHPLADAVTLLWQPSLPGDGTINGYRIYLNGKEFRQALGTSMTVPVPPLRQVAFAVAAVDTRGHLSTLSNTVTISAGHEPPDRPGGLLAQTVSDSEVDLSWSPSIAYGGARVAYRVVRDGKTIGQTTGTTYTVGHLAAGTGYSFSVVAVDSVGYASDASDLLAITTAPPPQTRGSAHVFLLASTDASFEAFQQRYQQIGTVYPTYYGCDGNGDFSGRDDQLITGWARLRGVKVEARWVCQGEAPLHLLLTDAGRRAALVQQIVAAAVSSSWDGVNLDFESGAATDRGLFTTFVGELASGLHAAGKTLSVDVSAKTKDVKNHPRSTFYDYDALSPLVDTIFVMCWGIHWSTSGPGAIEDWSWVQQVVTYLDARPNKDRYVLGFGMYGFDWPAGGGIYHKATALEYKDVLALAARYGVDPVWDSNSLAPHFSYTDGSGVHHDVWYTDSKSLGLRIQLAHDNGLAVGLWRLGEEDPGIWDDPLLQPGAW